MLRFLRRHRTKLILLAALLLPLFTYRAHSVRPGRANAIDRGVLALTLPLRSLLVGMVGEISEAWSNYVDLVDARRENIDLRRRVGRLEADQDRKIALERENDVLRRLLALKAANPVVGSIAAKVVGAGASPLSRTLTIDHGSLSEVTRGQAVVSEQGLVGVVQKVGWTSAEVLLIVDPSMTARVKALRSGTRGRLLGRGLRAVAPLELTEIRRSDDLRAGDRLVTSGQGGIFPPGVSVGHVLKVFQPEGQQQRAAQVVPYIDFARLEQVLVLQYAQPPEFLATPEPLLPVELSGSSTPAASRTEDQAEDRPEDQAQ